MKKIVLYPASFISLFLSSVLSNAQTASVPSRLVAYAIYSNSYNTDFLLTDSVFFQYSGNRGGDASVFFVGNNPLKQIDYLDGQDAFKIKYDSAFTINHNYSYNGDIVNANYYLQRFDAHNNCIERARFSNNWVLYGQPQQFIYDANNNLLSSFDGATKYSYTYSSSNILQAKEMQTEYGATLLNNNIDYYTYDSTSKLLFDKLLTWSNATDQFVPSFQYTYQYDNNNNLIANIAQTWDPKTSNWDNYLEHLYTYDASNNMLSDVLIYINGVPDSDSRYIYTYNNSHDVLTKLYQTYYAGGRTWQNDYYDIYTYDAHHNILSDTSKVSDRGLSPFVYAMISAYTYNTYQQLTSITHLNANIAGDLDTANIQKQIFYYQQYDTTQSVINTSNNIITIYPCPAQTAISISILWNTPQSCTIKIYDIQGRLVEQLSQPSSLSVTAKLPVTQLSSGNYFLEITSNSGKTVKQFVVAH